MKDVWNVVLEIVIINGFIKVNIVDVLLLDEVLLVFVVLIVDLLFVLVVFFYSDSEVLDFDGFFDVDFDCD